MNIRKHLTALLTALAVCTLAAAQNSRTVSVNGTVRDSAGDPIPGAAVVIQGKSTGTTAGMDGKYKIDVAAGTVLEFSALSYVPETRTVSKGGIMDIVLKDDRLNLEEAVVVGYGSQSRAKITGSVAVVSTSDFDERPLTDVSLALQGKVAGLQVTQNSGQPGEDNGTVIIRGIGTMNDSSPLVVIDGFESSFSNVDPKDIESISVLKDAASAAIYGNKAANGVILITTKQAKAHQMKVSYSGYGAVQQVANYPDLINSVEFITLYNEASVNSGLQPRYAEGTIEHYDGSDPGFYPSRNWADWYFKPAYMHNHYVSISGGSEESSFVASLGYLGQDGIVEGTDFSKLNFRINSKGSFLKKKLNVNFSLAGYKSDKLDFPNGSAAVLSRIVKMNPMEKPYYEGYGWVGWFADDARLEAGGKQTTGSYNMSAILQTSYDIGAGFSASVSGNLNYTINDNQVYSPNIDMYISFTSDEGYSYLGKSNSVRSYIAQSFSRTCSEFLTAQLNYNKSFGNHNIATLAGWQISDYNYLWYRVFRYDLTTNLPSLSVGDPETENLSDDANSSTNVSAFSRISYDYMSKYLFEANFRADGSSKFAKNHKWGYFPSFSAGWRISEESFMKGVKWIDDLKIRASWGQLGNQNIWSAFAGKDVLAIGESNYIMDGKDNTGANTSYIASDKLSWETTTQTNLGFDAYFLHSFSMSVDIYNKRTDDILMRLPISKIYGFTEDPYTNAGVVRNRGIDLDLQYFNNFGKLKVKVGGTFSYNRNVILDLHGQSPIIDSAAGLAHMEGYAINSLYGFDTDGIYQSEVEIKNHLDTIDEDGNMSTPYCGLRAAPGDIKFVDQDGDGIIDLDHDRVILGSPNPDFLYSFNLNLNYGKWDFTAFLQGVQGGLGWSCEYLTAPFWGSATCPKWMLNRWTPEKPNNTYQRVYIDDQRGSIKSRYYAEDLSYLRLKNIELGFSIPHARFYVSGQNVFTLTRFKGFDPERSGIKSSSINDYPLVKTWTVGVNLNF